MTVDKLKISVPMLLPAVEWNEGKRNLMDASSQKSREVLYAHVRL